VRHIQIQHIEHIDYMQPTSFEQIVRPFFAPLTVLKKELGDELRKKDTNIPLSVHWGIFI
jgi:hypothetical protein